MGYDEGFIKSLEHALPPYIIINIIELLVGDWVLIDLLCY
jgi:purine-cytosine permease-like protein